MIIKILNSVTVITPTIGKNSVFKAISSVKKQTYGNIKHLVIVDGKEHASKVSNMLTYDEFNDLVTVLPENTGSNGFYGHRIYAAFSHLVNSDYVFFLDEDNWYDENHVETLVELLNKKVELNFAFSLRKICDVDGKYLTNDDCESLGGYPIWCSNPANPDYLIDTSSFAFRKDFLKDTGHLWHSGWGGDRRYLAAVKDRARFACSGEYTMNYRLDGNPNSVNESFFIAGNDHMNEKYKGNLPWKNSYS